ncbi:MAG: 8-amino-7-oxononanoate synthase [Acidobacteria bacterium]|nr:8-amino-7-oxononanoate synthase [Acidobacteriota bacterium]
MFADPSDNGSHAFVRDKLDALRKSGLWRKLRDLEGAPGPRILLNGRSVLLLCSNNYLGLATDDRVKQAAREALDAFGCGATGSRLISGNLEPYRTLERELADFKGTEAALVFTSGYHANVGTIAALVGSGDCIFSDALNHASLIDGSRLSGAEIFVYRHCDTNDLEENLARRGAARRKLILTESVFSMDGDLAPLKDLVFLAKKYGAMLLVDEAHTTGVFGATGAGRIEELGLQQQVDIQMGTFSKALGSLGGYIAASQDVVWYLIHRARSLVFTTGLPPSVVAASTAALRIVRSEPHRRQQLWRNVGHLRKGLEDLGFELGPSQSQILPLPLGEDRRTMAACRYLLRNGVFVQGIRPPTVPPGTARLRIAPTAAHSEQDVQQALAAFARLHDALRSPQPLSSRATR